MSNKSDEIIRCKDCRYHRVYTFKNGETDSYCDYFGGFWSKYEVEDDDYCSNAIRKDEEE